VLEPHPVLGARTLGGPEDRGQRLSGGDGVVIGRGAVERHVGQRL
jgi:hypothetical protein